MKPVPHAIHSFRRRFPGLASIWPELVLMPLLAISLLLMLDTVWRFPPMGLLFHLDALAYESLALAAVFYAAAHALRAARLSLLLGVGRVPFYAILGCNAGLSFLTLALPFKIGELARALEFYRLTRFDPRAVFAIWIERCFDAVIVLCLIELASNAVLDQAFAQLTRRGLLALLCMSFFVVLFGRSALSALLRLLSASQSRRSLRLMRLARRMEALAQHMPPLAWPDLALLLIISGAIWLLEIAAVVAVTAGTMEFHHRAIDAFVEVVVTAAAGVGNSGALAVLLYRVLISVSLAAIALACAGQYRAARRSAAATRVPVRDYLPRARQPFAAMQGARVR